MQCRWLVSLLLVLGTVLYTSTFASFCLLCFFTGTVSCKHLHFSFFLSPLFLLVLFPAPYLHFSLFLSPLFFTGTVSGTHLHFCLFLSPLNFYRYCFLCHTCIFVCFCLLWVFLQVLGYCLVHLHFCMLHFQYLCTPAHLFDFFTGTGYCWVFVVLCINSNGKMHMNLRMYLLCLCYFRWLLT